MWTVVVVIVEIFPENSSKMFLVENDHVVKAFSTDRADDPLDIGVGIPRGMHAIATLR